MAPGLTFLKYISEAFESKRKALLAEDALAAEDRDEYLADNVFWVPKEARWSQLQANARLPTIYTTWRLCKMNLTVRGIDSARRPWATPTTYGCNTSTTIWRPTAWLASCWPTAP